MRIDGRTIMNFDKTKLLLTLVFIVMTFIGVNSFSSSPERVYISYGEIKQTDGRLTLAYKIVNDTTSDILIPGEYYCSENPLVARDVFDIRELDSQDILKYKGPFFNPVRDPEPVVLPRNSHIECQSWLNLSYSIEQGTGKKYSLKPTIKYRLSGKKQYNLVESELYIIE